MNTHIFTALVRTLALLPQGRLAYLESLARNAQGKGWGASTTRSEVAAMLELAPRTNNEPLRVLDIGANVGDWSAAMLECHSDAQVVAFEPSAAAYVTLSQRFGGDDRVTLVPTALSSAPGRAELWTDRPGSGLASLSQRRLDHLGIAFTTHESVSVSTVDAWCAEHQFQPTHVKIDVEGHEFDVLAGAKSTLSAVHVIQFEFGGCNIDSRTYFQDFHYLFSRLGFVLYRLTPRGPKKLGPYTDADESFVTTNYFAVRA